MSSGQYKRHDGFNQMQIKNGYIAHVRKDGTIKQYYNRKTMAPVSKSIAEQLNSK